MRLALVDSVDGAWPDRRHRLAPLGDALRSLGHEAVLIDAAARVERVPYIAGLARESDIAGLIAAARLPQQIRDGGFDACICPLRGGLAHGILMARACGELPAELDVLLIAEAPSRTLALRADVGRHGLRTCVDDALERVCLAHGDLLLAPFDPTALRELGVPLPTSVPLPATAALSPDVLAARGPDPASIAFVGPFERGSGVVAFIDAIERLASAGRMTGRSVLFAGPIEDRPLTVGKQWLGRRASRWAFPFRIVETSSPAVALANLPESFVALLPSLPCTTIDDIAILRDASVSYLGADAIGDGFALEAAIGSCLASCPREGSGSARMPKDADAARTILAALPVRRPSPVPGPNVGMSVCIIHHDRPAMLIRAVDSVLGQAGPGDDIEVLVLDNGSTRSDSVAVLDRLAAMPGLHVIRLAEGIPVAAALNRIAAEARRDFLVFLDDDNLMAEGGVQALARACAGGRFDVIASNLEIFENDAVEPGPTVAKTLFIGPAASAGLFFNGFGDTSMAIRRESFHALGGFVDAAGPYPASDWIMLARAQNAGLRIGVLQKPAFRYRRDVHKHDVHWQKYDQHGIRQHLLRVYGPNFDPLLVAGLAQAAVLEDQ